MLPITFLTNPTPTHIERIALALKEPDINSNWYGLDQHGTPQHVGYSPYDVLSGKQDITSSENGPQQLMVYTIMLPDDKPIGEGQIHINMPMLEAQIYIIIYDSSLWYRGFGTSALINLLIKIFDELQLHRAYMDIPSNNPSAIHMAEKAGFVLEGKLRSTHFLNGEWHDSLVYGLLVNEYKTNNIASLDK